MGLTVPAVFLPFVARPRARRRNDMREYRSLAHTRWDCKYHVVFIPKYRKKVIYGDLRAHLGEIFHELAGYRECRIEEGHLMGDHVHMCISIPPKYAVSKTVGYIRTFLLFPLYITFGLVLRRKPALESSIHMPTSLYFLL